MCSQDRDRWPWRSPAFNKETAVVLLNGAPELRLIGAVRAACIKRALPGAEERRELLEVDVLLFHGREPRGMRAYELQ